MLDENNLVKPAGNQIAELIAEYRRNPLAPIHRTCALVLPEAVFQRTGDTVRDFASVFMDEVEKGQHPAVVLESRSADSAYLQSRGIEHLIRIPEKRSTKRRKTGGLE